MTGIERIAAERQRQIDTEGWTHEHDDEHDDGSMATVAALYASPKPLWDTDWPWDPSWDKRPRAKEGFLLYANDTPTLDRVRALEKAGALIAAEIDRLLRKETSP